MEYLTLQDIPLRQYDPLHSRRMASSQSNERPLNSLAAAVSHSSDYGPSRTLLPIFLPRTAEAPSQNAANPDDLREERTTQERSYPYSSYDAYRERTREDSQPPPPSGLFGHRVTVEYHFHDVAEHDIMSFASLGERKHSFDAGGYTVTVTGKSYHYPRTQNYIEQNLRRISTLTDTQHHQNLRRTPPIQPGEIGEKLPSFSELLYNTRAETPPRTPSRRNGSANHSPREQPAFDDVAWQDSKRRRVERSDSIWAHSHHAQAAEQLPADPRRMNSAIDPALQSQNSTHAAVHPGALQHHRPSLSYPPPHAPAPLGVHNRHQSSPGPQAHPAYQSSSGHPTRSALSAYPPPTQHSAAYDHRHSYYQDPAPAPHPAYGYPQDSYYNRSPYPGAPHPAYETGYPDIRFQQHIGVPEHGRKRRGNLPKEATNLMKEWYAANRTTPYPSEDQKIELCRRTGLNISQVSNWFINARRRQPEKEKRELEAARAKGNNGPEK